MPAPRCAFNPPYDIHLLRGQFIELSNLLEIDGTKAADYIDAHATIKYTFQTSFNASNNLKLTATIGNVASRKPTCTIQPDATAPTDPKFQITSFLVYVVVTDTSDNSTSETAIRIHVHKTIQKVWMTPDPITVYQGMTGARSAVYALFDDHVVAEIGDIYVGDNEEIIQYNITSKVQIKWACTALPALINDSGRIAPTTSTVAKDYPVQITVKYGSQTISATGTVRVSNALSANQTAIKAELVASGGCPGFAKLNEVPNILFVAEGFTNPKAFDDLVDNYVSDLVSKKISSPFDLLKGSINFWKVFVPSGEPGLTYRSVLEVLETEPNTLLGSRAKVASKPASDDASTWTNENLLYFVGVPVKNDAIVSDSNIRLRWENTTRLTTAQLDVLFGPTSLLMPTWRSDAERRLPDAKDTAFGISVNDYTAAEREDRNYNMINFDKRRVQRDFLDGFFGSLNDTDNNLIGPVFVMDTVAGHRGKDFDNILFLLVDGRGRAQNETGYLFSAVDSTDTIKLKGTLADDRVSEIAISVPSRLPLLKKGTITHELAHSFGLGDEYGEQPDDNSFIGKAVTDPLVVNWPSSNYQRAVYFTDEFSNIQAKKDFERPKTGGGPGTEIDAYKIKWRYHRIQKCSLVTAISTSGNEVVLTIKNPEVAFKVNETAFFRKRQVNRFQLRVFDKNHTIVADVVNPATLAKAFTAYYVNVSAIDLAANKITIKSDFGTNVTSLELKAGQASFFKIGQRLDIQEKRVTDPIYTILRTPAPTVGQPDVQTRSLSPGLTVKSVAGNKVTLQIAGAVFPAGLTTLNAGEEMLLYAAVAVRDNQGTDQYRYAELITKPVLDYLDAHPYPLNANAAHEEIIRFDPIENSSLPKELFPCCSRRKKEIVGLYNGGMTRHGGIYHPTARCMMHLYYRKKDKDEELIEMCAVCRYTLINMIDPTKFGDFDTDYLKRKIYPDVNP